MQRDYDLEEEKLLEAQNIAYVANVHKPSEESWGMESYGGSKMGGYYGIFFWFSSKEELLDFTAQVFPFLGSEIGCEDPFAGAEKAVAVVDAVKAGSLTWDEGRISITKLLTKGSAIRWWGQLKNLFDGDGEFERELRASSRSSVGCESEDTSPIKDAEKARFMSDLKGYLGS